MVRAGAWGLQWQPGSALACRLPTCHGPNFTHPLCFLNQHLLLADNYEATCAFTDFANWLIPGRVMLGRYPFVEPSRCRSRDVGEEQLRQLLSAGITAFVSLQVGRAVLGCDGSTLRQQWHRALRQR